MRKYEKIDTIFARDIEGTKKLMPGVFRDPTIEYLAHLDWDWTEKVDGCLRNDTKLLQTNGEYITIKSAVEANKPIEIYGYKDGKIIPTKVLAFHNNGNSNEWYKIKFNRRGLGTKGNSYGVIESTANHKFFINGNYKRADELQIGDKITYMREEQLLTFVQEQKTFEMEILDIEIKHENHNRYDLTTETHNYFANGVLVHNCNIRVHWDGHQITFGGRTDNAQIPVDLVTYLNKIFINDAAEELFEQTFDEHEVIIFGEGYGRKIQKVGTKYIQDHVDFIVFDVLIGDNYQTREDVERTAAMFGLKTVPIVGHGSLWKAVKYVSEHPISQIAESEVEMEGIVCRPSQELQNRCGNRIIVKIKWNDIKELIEENSI